MEITSLSPHILFFLFCAAGLAGFLDTLAGGGGLIALPAIILSGVPPLTALGTNKLQGTVGTLTASLIMFRTRRVSFQQVKYLMLYAFIGSACGTIAVQFIDTSILHIIIPMALLVTGLYFLLSPGLHNRQLPEKLSEPMYKKAIVPIIGWYDGMFGPGTGSYFVLAGVTLRGLKLIDSTAVAKSLNFATNFASLLLFLSFGKVMWLVGLVMMAGQFIGAWLGAHFLLKINPLYIRFLVVIMSFGMLLKYGFSMGWFS